MPNLFKKSLYSIAFVATSIYAATTLSPNTNQNSGVIPSGHTDLVFEVSNGNWVKTLSLPEQAQQGNKITIRSSAGYTTYLDTKNSNFPSPSQLLEISSGDEIAFVFNAIQKKWLLSTTTYTPNQHGASIPNLGEVKAASYRLADGNWTANINLPSVAKNNQVIFIQSSATWPAQITPANILFSSSFSVKNGDEYAFIYNASLSKWILATAPNRVLQAKELQGSIPVPTSPQTTVQINNGDGVTQLSLPVTAGDRDRITINSSSLSSTKIENRNINTTASLSIKQGESYQFMYVTDKAHWVLMKSPKPIYQVKNIQAGQLQNQTTPVMEVNAGDGNWQSKITLPKQAQAGDQVIVRSAATYGLNVISNGLDQRIERGETYRFIYASDNTWKTETNRIDLLLVLSPENSKILGETAAKMRAIEGLRLTNEAAENSNANFYVKQVGLFNYKIPGDTTLKVIDLGRADKILQAERERLKADAIYYAGNEDGGGGCGWAYVGVNDAFNMIGADNLECGMTAMRHEFAHNMGISHAGDQSNVRPYAVGFNHILGSSALGGNDLPYYSSPKLYNPLYSVRLGEDEKIDAIRAINERSAMVSKFK